MAQLVEALGYKPESRGFDSRWRRMEFWLHWLNPYGRTMALTLISAKNISGRRKGGQFLRLTNLPHSCADWVRMASSLLLWGQHFVYDINYIADCTRTSSGYAGKSVTTPLHELRLLLHTQTGGQHYDMFWNGHTLSLLMSPSNMSILPAWLSNFCWSNDQTLLYIEVWRQHWL